MELLVKEIRQQASGGSYVVRYRAEFKWKQRGVDVSVVSVIPEDASEELADQAVIAVKAGFEQVLIPRGLGAEVKLHELLIHDVDFNAGKFQEVTARVIQQHLSGK